MSKLEAFEALELFLREFPEMKDRCISLNELGNQALDEQIEEYDLAGYIVAR